MIDHFVSLLASDSKDVLDAGCGTGRMSRYLTDRGAALAP
jgi:2-polyprenyl-3-methyl-5-hydroxy-6-metoxy-1,4-benzoquinol methylase